MATFYLPIYLPIYFRFYSPVAVGAHFIRDERVIEPRQNNKSEMGYGIKSIPRSYQFGIDLVSVKKRSLSLKHVNNNDLINIILLYYIIEAHNNM